MLEAHVQIRTKADGYYDDIFVAVLCNEARGWGFDITNKRHCAHHSIYKISQCQYANVTLGSYKIVSIRHDRVIPDLYHD